jgi:hypothetical protein
MMKHRSFSLLMLFFGLLLPVHIACGQTSREILNLVGDWKGESLCVNKEKFPACKDEVVVYHIVVTKDKADTVTLSADKIVNGTPEFMGAFDFLYDVKKQTLTSEFKNERVHLALEFVVKGDTLSGTMSSLPEKIVARRMEVKKEKNTDESH